MNGPQVIVDAAGNPAYAVLPWRDYEHLVGDAALSDEELYDRAAREGGESFPIDVADRILAGESPIRVYRRYRGMTQRELAAAAGINPVYLSQIERGQRTGSMNTLSTLARLLDVAVDDVATSRP